MANWSCEAKRQANCSQWSRQKLPDLRLAARTVGRSLQTGCLFPTKGPGAAGAPVFLVWTLRKAPWLANPKPPRCTARSLAPGQGCQDQAEARRRAHPRDSAGPRRLSHRYFLGSDTGAVEMALWSLLGHCGVDVLAWESFGEGWVTDIVKQLQLKDVRILKAGYGEIVDLKTVNFDHDVVFTWNGTTSGVRVPNGDWIAADRKGLTICDATSAAFA